MTVDTYRVRDVPRWQDRLYLRCKYVPWLVLMLLGAIVSTPLLLVVGAFFPAQVLDGLRNVDELANEHYRRACEEMRRLGGKPEKATAP